MNGIKNHFTLIAITTAILALPLSAFAQDVTPEESTHTLSEWTFGDIVAGDEPNEEYLKGKVVAIEYWGVR